MATIRAHYDPYQGQFTLGDTMPGLDDGDTYMDFSTRELDSLLLFDSEDELPQQHPDRG